jgi:lipopolysaccharide export system protein LptC
MSTRAEQIRDKRRAFAAPGGSLDRAVRLMAVGLPALVGAIAAAMLIAPLSPRGEVSFLLDRNKVATAEDRLRLDSAMYRGLDSQGRPFSLSAGEAVQNSASTPVVQLRDLTARLLLPEGPAVLTAPGGRFYIDTRQVKVDGIVRFAAADGYTLAAQGVAVDLPGRRIVGTGRVQGEVPAGTFEADSLDADLDERTVALDGRARLRMVPNRMRMP